MPQSDLTLRVHALNDRYRHHSAVSVLEHALRDPQAGKLALVSSFGAESVVLLHMVSVTRRDTPVIFIDTAMLFAETLVYQQELAERLNLSDLRIIRADAVDLRAQDPDATLHQRDTDACCALRKSAPLQAALNSFDGWITGRKRY
ncbi:MAG: phosphoadenosine phosphosulfate reductase family protein, partial [Roseovarius sp.]|nr:phosphoadenosine phosphosulfate reductase family protein [Roseovarius sp.]